MIIAVLAALAQSAAPTPPADGAAQPSAADLPKCPQHGQPARFYPEHAYRNGISGKVMLQCRVGDDQRLQDCVVLEETPPGERFGWAALGLARCAAPTKLPPGTVRTFPIQFSH